MSFARGVYEIHNKSRLGMFASWETKKKMSDAQKARWLSLSPEMKSQFIQSPTSPETRAKQSLSAYMREPRSLETKMKMSKSAIARWQRRREF